MPDFTYSLLTEPWIDIVTLKGESKSMGLFELFKSAHTLERLDFSMPGFDLAVLRFLVALVYIVSPPKDFEEWKGMIKARKFNKVFIDGLKKHEERFDLFHKKYPFMQYKAKTQDINLTSTTALFKTIPGKTSATHFKHIPHSIEYSICPKCSTPALLATHTFSNSGGVAPNETGQRRSYLAGINGASPIFMFLLGRNIYETICLNVISHEQINDIAEKKEISNKNKWPNLISKKFDINVKDIGIIDGYLWKPRNILFYYKNNVNKEKCIICNNINETIITSIDFRSGSNRIKDGSFWHDPMTARIHKEDNTITRAALSGSSKAERSGWRDYASLLYKETKIKKTKQGETIYERFIPVIVHQCSGIEKYLNPKVEIFSLIVETPSQPQIKKVLTGSYEFSEKLIRDDFYQNQLKEIISITDSSHGILFISLKTAYRDKINFSIAESFWKGLENNFNILLHEMISSDRDIIPLEQWYSVLIRKLRNLFNYYTKSIIDKPEYLISIEKGRKELDKFIYFNLNKKEVVTNDK